MFLKADIAVQEHQPADFKSLRRWHGTSLMGFILQHAPSSAQHFSNSSGSFCFRSWPPSCPNPFPRGACKQPFSILPPKANFVMEGDSHQTKARDKVKRYKPNRYTTIWATFGTSLIRGSMILVQGRRTWTESIWQHSYASCGLTTHKTDFFYQI